MKIRLPQFLTALFLTLVLPLSAHAQCSIEWIGASGGDWNTAALWEDTSGTNRVPMSTDDVCINFDATYTVTLSNPATVHSLAVGIGFGSNIQTLHIDPSQMLTIQDGGTVNTRGFLNNEGTLDLLGGTFTLTGDSRHAGAALETALGATLRFDTGTHTIAGTVTGTATGPIYMDVGTNLQADPGGGTLNIGGTGFDWRAGDIDGGGTFTNAGLLRLTTAATKELDTATTLLNTGTIEWALGTLFIQNGSTLQNEAILDAQNNTTITPFGTDPNTFVNTSTGQLIKSGGAGTLNVAVPIVNAGQVDAQSGTISFTQDGTHTDVTLAAAAGAAVRFDNGIHTISGTLSGTPDGEVFMDAGARLRTSAGSATLNLGGTGFDWRGGDIDGGGTFANDGLLRLTTSANKELNAATTLLNTGTIEWALGTLFIENGSTLQNEATFDAQNNTTITPFGTDPNTFVNTSTGQLIKSGGTGTLTVAVPIVNAGQVDAQSGTISFTQDGMHTDVTLTAAAGAAVRFDNGIHTISGTLSGTPDGEVYMDAGARLRTGAGSTMLNLGGTGFDWRGGLIDGGGTFTNDGLLRLTTSAQKELDAATTLHNTSTIEWELGTLFIENGSTLLNDGTFEAQNNTSLSPFGTGPNTFINNSSNSFIKSGGGGSTVISVLFENNGHVEAQTGTIQFNASTTQTNATLAAATDAAIFFDSGTHVISGTLSGTPAGSIYMNAGANLQADAAGGTLDIGGTGFDWQGGFIDGGGTLTNASLLRLTTAAGKELDAATTLHNTGTIEWALGTLFIENGSTLLNDGTFEAQNNTSLSPFGTGPNTFINNSSNSFIKSGGAGFTTISVPFENNGHLEAQTGTIRFTGPSTHTGATLAAATDAAIYFDSGTHVISGTLSGTPAGSIYMNAGANLQADVGGGTLDIGDTGFDWQGGFINGGEMLTNAGLMRISTAASKELDAGTTLRNTGTLTWENGTVFIENESALANEGLVEVLGNNNLSPFGTGANTFFNSGVFRKSGGGGTTTVAVPFANESGGVIDASSGTLLYSGNLANNDGGLIQGTETIRVTSATVTNEGAVGPGASPGILTHVGDYNMTAATTALNIELGGLTPGEHDQLVVTSGAATLGGSLNVSLEPDYTPETGDRFVILTATGGVSGTFTNTSDDDRIYLGEGLVFTVLYGDNDVELLADVLGTDFALTKTADQESVSSGSEVEFTVTVTNNGPDDLAEFGLDENVEVTDLLPDGLALVSATPSAGTYDEDTGQWQVASLPVGQTESLVLVAQVTAPGLYTNVATLTGNDVPDTNPANNEASASVQGLAADLALDKSVDPAEIANGETTTFTLQVTNLGPDETTGVQVEDLLPAELAFVEATASQGTYDDGTGLWEVGTLALDGSATLELVVSAQSVGEWQNEAFIVGSDLPDPDLDNNSSAATVTVLGVDVALTKVVDEPVVDVGTNVVFTVTATNLGDGTATGVEITDTLPAGLSLVAATPSAGTFTAGVWTLGALAPSQSEMLDLEVTVDEVGDFVNVANLTALDQIDSNEANNEAQAGVRGEALTADLSLSKTVDDPNVDVGSDATFTITLSNLGPNEAGGIEVTDLLPTGLAFVSASTSQGTYNDANGLWSVGTVAPDGDATLTLVATVTESGTVTNTAEITASDLPDPNTDNNTASASVNGQQVDVALDKTVDREVVTVGEDVVFTVTATNAGPAQATGIEVTDALPAELSFVSASTSQGTYDDDTGIWAVGTLDASATATLTLTATVTALGTATNTATVTAVDQPDSNSENDTASASVEGQGVDIAIAKTVEQADVEVGQEAVFAVTATNNGPGTATGIDVTDALPAELSFVSASTSQGSFDDATGIWSVGTLDASATATLMLTVTVDAEGTFTNTATLTAVDQPDTDDSNDSDTADVTGFTRSADLGLTKTVDQPIVEVGTDVLFTVTLTNDGPFDAGAITVTDQLPAGLAFVSASTSQGSYDDATGVWSVGSVAVDGTAMLDLVATVAEAGTFTNTAEVTASDVPDPNLDNNTASADVEGVVTATFALDVALRGSPALINPPAEIQPGGGCLFFVLTITNLSGEQQNVSLWGEVTDANGAVVKVTGPRPVRFAPGQEKRQVRRLCVPGALPAGAYTLTVLVGDFPDGALAQDSIGFTKLEGAAKGAMMADWSFDLEDAVDTALEAPTAFELGANYPNPFNPTTTITFAIAESQHVQLQVFDIMGRLVATLVDQDMAAGRYEASWHATDQYGRSVASGTYLYRLVTGEFTQTRQLTLVK